MLLRLSSLALITLASGSALAKFTESFILFPICNVRLNDITSYNFKSTGYTNMPKIQMNIKLDRKLKEELQKRADREKRTLSSYVNNVLETHVGKKK